MASLRPSWVSRVLTKQEALTNATPVFDSKTLIAQDILGGGFGGGFNNVPGIGGVGGFAGPTGGAILPTKTADVQLFGARPTWSSIADDPAATLGGIWQNELLDLQNANQDVSDNQINAAIAAQIAEQINKNE